MRYEFRIAKGKIIELEFPMSEAPELGEVVVVDGPKGKVRATRIVSSPGAVRVAKDWVPFVSHRLPRHLHGEKCDSHGRPIVTTRKDQDRICKKFGYELE